MKVLFVDDESMVLDALERALYDSEWDINFSSNAEAALEHLKKNHADVVISDMRMPGMSGAQLLNEVSIKYPHTFRVILSGQAGTNSALEASFYAHQWLDNPCSTEVIRELLEQIDATRNAFPNKQVRDAISGIKSLASPPNTYMRIQQLMRRNTDTIDDLAEIIASDVPLTTNILHLANSAFFSRGARVDDIGKAVVRLGEDTISSIVLLLGTYAAIPHADHKFFHEQQNHSLAISMLAVKIAPAELKSATQLAGLLHELGKLAILQLFPANQEELLNQYIQDQTLSAMDKERELFATDHAQVGAYLLQLWGFTLSLVEGILYQYNVERMLGREFDISTSLYIADCLFHDQDIDQRLIERFSLESQLGAWRDYSQKVKPSES
jgi:HD-like signal output (HDOD) protein/CheY-like chemotaxis protein